MKEKIRILKQIIFKLGVYPLRNKLTSFIKRIIGGKEVSKKGASFVDSEWQKLRSSPSEGIPEGEGLFALTTRISIELSNACNYIKKHPECPLAFETHPVVLPSELVYKVIDTAAEHNFKGVFSFHNYNEPLMDKRLIDFVKYVREKCADAGVYICTNGSLLNEKKAEELVSAGVTSIHVSAYSLPDYLRLKKLKMDIPYEVEPMCLFNKFNVYDKKVLGLKKPCLAPLNEIIVSREGKILLCCQDWDRRYPLGDLSEMSLEEIMRSRRMRQVYERLSAGDRFLEICKRCDWAR